MRRSACGTLGLVAFAAFFSQHAAAQSIGFAPAAPTAADSITVKLSEPFNCTAPQPTLAASSGNSLLLESVLPNGIVNCPAIPDPPPILSNFSVPLGFLAPGKYAVSWNIYLSQSPDAPKLLASKSATLTVAAAVTGAGTAAVDSSPSLSAWGLLALVGLCGGYGAHRLRRRIRRPG